MSTLCTGNTLHWYRIMITNVLFQSCFFFSCWLGTENGLIWAFGVPVACVLIVNLAMFAVAIRIAKRSIQKRGESSERTMALIKGSMSLLCILGITWILGFTYFANGSQFLAVIFALLNSAQVN